MLKILGFIFASIFVLSLWLWFLDIFLMVAKWFWGLFGVPEEYVEYFLLFLVGLLLLQLAAGLVRAVMSALNSKKNNS